MTNQPAANAGFKFEPDAQLRLMRILWAAFLMTIGLFVIITYFARPDADVIALARRDSPVLLIALAALGLSLVAASFVLKASYHRRAAERQEPATLQTGFILALALCESAVLFGLVALFVTWNDYAYGLLALGAAGEALHFPTREQILSAYYKPAG